MSCVIVTYFNLVGPACTSMLVADDADVLVYVDGAELVAMTYERYRSPRRTDEEVAQPDPTPCRSL